MIENILAEGTCKALDQLYQLKIGADQIIVQKTNKEFEGDYTINVFPYLKYSKKPPEVTAADIGDFLRSTLTYISHYNVIKGFLNLVIGDNYWNNFFMENFDNHNFGTFISHDDHPVVIEYSSPNTNKPLHLGHIRNNLLGYSLAQIQKANGKRVVKVNLVNDRGIHICKSMLAWEKWANGETPESTGMKGDHLIGKYYVLFEKNNQKQIDQLKAKGLSGENIARSAQLIQEAQQLLKKWEQKDEHTVNLWKTMNRWAYDGFDITYKNLGVDFDKTYYESDTYLLGREIVMEGLKRGIFYRKSDGSVWADLTDENLDEKILLRADGTSVYITQDLGTAQLRHDDYDPEELVYVVGNEQIYHFDVLKILLKKLGKEWYENIYHLSYGMVELPEGKMKSREGKVVDADELMDEMILTAKKTTQELGKIEDFSGEAAEELYRIVGLGALKYFILKVDPKKTMLFNPEESIDFNGNTGPFIQYTYARIKSVLRKADSAAVAVAAAVKAYKLNEKERDLVKLLYEYPEVIRQAGEQYSPALVANYVYELAKEYNQFYHDHSILKANYEQTIHFRIVLSKFTGEVIRKGMALLGIEVPEKM